MEIESFTHKKWIAEFVFVQISVLSVDTELSDFSVFLAFCQSSAFSDFANDTNFMARLHDVRFVSKHFNLHLRVEADYRASPFGILRRSTSPARKKTCNWTHIIFKMVMKSSFWGESWNPKRAVHLNSPMSDNPLASVLFFFYSRCGNRDIQRSAEKCN